MKNPLLECTRLVHVVFKGDKVKTRLWFYTYNPYLCCIPLNMIAYNRTEKLLKIIKDMTNGNVC